jgi:hypothetical protein
MKSLRSLLGAFWLALALLAGQHFAATHAFAHLDRASSQKQVPPQPHCDQCFFAATVAGAIPAGGPPPLAAPPALIDAAAWSDRAAIAARHVLFLSRAPPSPLR